MLVWLKKLTLFVLLLILIIAFTGININKHTCISCQKTLYYIFSHNDCCSGHYLSHQNEQQDCCRNHDEEKHCNIPQKNCKERDCCQSKKILLRVTNQFLLFTSFFNIKAVQLQILTMLIHTTDTDVFIAGSKPLTDTFRPPPLHFISEDIIQFTHKLLFYA